MYKTAIFSFFLCLSVTSPVWAETWEDAKPRVEEMLSQEPIPCDELWDEIWPWFKRGEAEVIEGLMMGSAGWGDIAPPLAEDEIQARNERFSMDVYRILARAGKLDQSTFKENPITSLNAADDYLACIQRNPEEVCAENAMEAGSVLPFNNFIRLIESRIEGGRKPICLSSSEK